VATTVPVEIKWLMHRLWEVLTDRVAESMPLSIDREHNDTCDLCSVAQPEDLSSHHRRRHDAVVLGTKLSDARHELGI
jgi:hypothetical protein